MLWLCLLLALVVGSVGGGWQSLRHARQGEMDQALRLLRIAGCLAAACGMLVTTLTLGWPWKGATVSVPEEVSRTVVDTVEVPVKVTKWFFWKTEKTETKEVPRQVTETVYRTESVREFSFWLLLPVALVGFVCYKAERGIVRLLWRFFG